MLLTNGKQKKQKSPTNKQTTRFLTVPVVVAVFLTLTLAAAFFTADAVRIENGLTGLGLSMAAGGLLAALVGYNLPQGRTGKSRRRRRS